MDRCINWHLDLYNAEVDYTGLKHPIGMRSSLAIYDLATVRGPWQEDVILVRSSRPRTLSRHQYNMVADSTVSLQIWARGSPRMFLT